MKKYTLEVWERTGFVTVEANSKQEAFEKVDEAGYDFEEFDYEPFNDGQYYEVR